MAKKRMYSCLDKPMETNKTDIFKAPSAAFPWTLMPLPAGLALMVGRTLRVIYREVC